MRTVAEFLLTQVYDHEDGGLFKSLMFDAESDAWQPEIHDGKTLRAQMAGIRGLLVAYHRAKDVRYRSKAFELYQFIEQVLWDTDIQVYKDREKQELYVYTPLDVGTVIGALRESF